MARVILKNERRQPEQACHNRQGLIVEHLRKQASSIMGLQADFQTSRFSPVVISERPESDVSQQSISTKGTRNFGYSVESSAGSASGGVIRNNQWRLRARDLLRTTCQRFTRGEACRRFLFLRPHRLTAVGIAR
jgi:hypothetical protein